MNHLEALCPNVTLNMLNNCLFENEKRNVVLINNATHQRETLSEWPIRLPLSAKVLASSHRLPCHLNVYAKCIWHFYTICIIILKRVYQSPSVLVNNMSVASSKLNLLNICSHINKNICMKTQTSVSTVQFKFYRPIVDLILKSNKIRFKTSAALTYLNEWKRIWLHKQPPECTVLAFKCLIFNFVHF